MQYSTVLKAASFYHLSVFSHHFMGIPDNTDVKTIERICSKLTVINLPFVISNVNSTDI